jgi:hypothetical protein
VANLIREGVLDRDPMNLNFKNLLWRVWVDIIGMPPSPLQYDFADFLQQNPEMARSIILMAFRGAAKSYVTTTFAVWLLKRDRSEQVLVTSATGGFAGNIATFAWQMVSNLDYLSDMKPSTDQRRSALAFDVAGCPPAQKDESFAAVSITGQITGRRASRIIGDDLETPNTSDTESARTDLEKRSSELAGAILKPGGSIYLLGTPQTEDTMYIRWADEKGYELRIYPITYPRVDSDPKVDEMRRYGTRLAPLIRDAVQANPHLAGTSVEPGRFTEVDILKRRREWGLTEFERQFKMFTDAGAGRGNPLKLRDFPVMELTCPGPHTPHMLLPAELDYMALPQHLVKDISVDAMTGDSLIYAPARVDILLKPEEVVCYVDPSGEGDDETTWTIGAGLQGRVFVLFQGASTDGHTKEVLDKIAADCKRWRVTTVKVESNFGQGMFGELLAPAFADIHWEVAIEEERQGKVSKEKRIVETLEPAATDHRIVLAADLLRRDFEVTYEHVEQAKRRYHRLTYQLTRITKQKGALKFDDRVDGLSGLAAHFIGVLLRQLKKHHDEARLKAIDQEAEAMIAERKRQGLPLFGLPTGDRKLGKPSPRHHKGRR